MGDPLCVTCGLICTGTCNTRFCFLFRVSFERVIRLGVAPCGCRDVQIQELVLRYRYIRTSDSMKPWTYTHTHTHTHTYICRSMMRLCMFWSSCRIVRLEVSCETSAEKHHLRTPVLLMSHRTAVEYSLCMSSTGSNPCKSKHFSCLWCC